MEHVWEIMLSVVKAAWPVEPASLSLVSIFSLNSINPCFGLSNLLSISNISTENF